MKLCLPFLHFPSFPSFKSFLPFLLIPLSSSPTLRFRCPSGGTRAAYENGASTPPCRSWKLDHLLFSDASQLRFVAAGEGRVALLFVPKCPSCRASYVFCRLQPLPLHLSLGLAFSRPFSPRPRPRCVAVWAGLEDDPASSLSGTPSLACPSDHLPVHAAFSVAPAKSLAPCAKEALAARWAAMATAHASAAAALVAELDAQQAKLEAAERAAVEAAPAGQAPQTAQVEGAAQAEGGAGSKSMRGGKAGKAGKGRPSEAAVALLRLRRKRLRALAQAQDGERLGAAAALGGLERDAAESLGLFGLGPAPGAKE